MAKVKMTIDQDKCKGCGLCVSVCPKKILQIAKGKINSRGHCPVEITDPEACIGCASCFTICPDCVIRIEK